MPTILHNGKTLSTNEAERWAESLMREKAFWDARSKSLQAMVARADQKAHECELQAMELIDKARDAQRGVAA